MSYFINQNVGSGENKFGYKFGLLRFQIILCIENLFLEHDFFALNDLWTSHLVLSLCFPIWFQAWVVHDGQNLNHLNQVPENDENNDSVFVDNRL